MEHFATEYFRMKAAGLYDPNRKTPASSIVGGLGALGLGAAGIYGAMHPESGLGHMEQNIGTGLSQAGHYVQDHVLSNPYDSHHPIAETVDLPSSDARSLARQAAQQFGRLPQVLGQSLDENDRLVSANGLS